MDDAAGHGLLLQNLVLFGRLLRSAGLKVTPAQLADLAEALAHVGLSRRDDVHAAARAVLVSRREHLPTFDRAFELFWKRWLAPGAAVPNLKPAARGPRRLEPVGAVLLGADEASRLAGREDQTPPERDRRTYSARETLRRKDFSELTPDELQEVRRLMRSMRWNLELRRSLRRVPATSGRALDLRRTLRQSFRHGAEPLRLAWRRRKLKRRPLVLLCDISGSMEPYSRILLQFVYAVSHGLEKVEAFVFGTRLTRITRHLDQPDAARALTVAAGAVQDWAGGTRIGETLKSFNYQWGRRVLARGAIVLIISDGWDRGDVELLEREMDRLQRSCHRLVWLNPLLGSPRYEPLTRGIRAALPYVDDFLPVHNLQSLEELGSLLSRLGERRPPRRQRSGAPPTEVKPTHA